MYDIFVFLIGSDLKNKILQMKENGNLAYKNKDYEEALVFYNRAINLARGFENLNRDLAVVLTNRSAVHSMMHSTIEALEDAEEAVKCDQTWMKVCGYNKIKFPVEKYLGVEYSVFSSPELKAQVSFSDHL